MNDSNLIELKAQAPQIEAKSENVRMDNSLIVIETADQKFINEAMRTRGHEFPRIIHFGWRIDRGLIKL